MHGNLERRIAYADWYRKAIKENPEMFNRKKFNWLKFIAWTAAVLFCSAVWYAVLKLCL